MKRMLAVWALFVWAAPLWAAPPASQSCNLQTLASLELVGTDRILVPVDYRGQTVWMILDLEQPMSLLSPDAVAPLKLTTQRIESRPGQMVEQTASR